MALEQRAYCPVIIPSPSIIAVVVDMEEETVLDGETEDPVRLRLLHNERPDWGDKGTIEGIPFRRTNGEVTAFKLSFINTLH